MAYQAWLTSKTRQSKQQNLEDMYKSFYEVQDKTQKKTRLYRRVSFLCFIRLFAIVTIRVSVSIQVSISICTVIYV